MEDNYQKIYDIFKTYFKKEFNPEELENHFPDTPSCRLFEAKSYYTEAGTWEAFTLRSGDKSKMHLYPGTNRLLKRDLKFRRCIAITNYEKKVIKATMPEIDLMVDFYLMLACYSMHELGVLPKDCNFYIGSDIKFEETEQYHSLQEAGVCSSSQEADLSGQL